MNQLPKEGDIIEVQDEHQGGWSKRTFFAFVGEKILCHSRNSPGFYCAWYNWRPIKKEPVVTYTYRNFYTDGEVGLEFKDHSRMLEHRCGTRVLGHIEYEKLDGKIVNIKFIKE